MGQEDRLKREIDKLGQVLERLLSSLKVLKTSGHTDKIKATANKELKESLGFSFEEIVAQPQETLIAFLKNQPLSTFQIGLLGDILYETTEIDNLSNKQDIELREKTLIIYDYLLKNDTTYSYERHFKLNKIKIA